MSPGGQNHPWLRITGLGPMEKGEGRVHSLLLILTHPILLDRESANSSLINITQSVPSLTGELMWPAGGSWEQFATGACGNNYRQITPCSTNELLFTKWANLVPVNMDGRVWWNWKPWVFLLNDIGPRQSFHCCQMEHSTGKSDSSRLSFTQNSAQPPGHAHIPAPSHSGLRRKGKVTKYINKRSELTS